MSECFNTEELLANVRKLANENDDLRDQVGERRAKAEEASKRVCELEAWRFEALKAEDAMRTHINDLCAERDAYKRELENRKTLSVKDFMGTLSRNGAQSVLIGFK